MKKRNLIILSCLFILCSCSSKLPTQEEMKRDIKSNLIEKYATSTERDKAEQKKRLAKAFSQSEIDDMELVFDWDGWLKNYEVKINNMNFTIQTKRNGDVLNGRVLTINEYGSEVETTFLYIRTQKGWEFSDAKELKTIKMSDKEKLQKLQGAIAIYYANNDGKYPKKLEDLVPKYINEIPGGDWEYNSKTGMTKN